jgi:hypothetical protein
MSTRGGTVLVVLLVMLFLAIGLLARASRSTRREVGTLVVELQGVAGAKLQILVDGKVVVAAIGGLDTTRFGRSPVLGSGLPEEGQEAVVYNFESLRTSHSPCWLNVAVAGLGQDLDARHVAPIRREGDASPSLPAAVAILGCPDLVRQFARPSEEWKSTHLLVLEGTLEITAREGDALVGTLTAPLVLSAYLSL